MNRNDKQHCDDAGIDRDRQQRVHAAQPPPAQALHIKLFKQANAATDKDRIYDGIDNGAARSEAGQPGE
jgi:hypothetical protein